MKILMVTHTFLPKNIGGAEYHLKALSNELTDRGHKVTILGPEGGSSEVECEYIEQEFEGWKKKIEVIQKIRGLSRERSFDVIHSQFTYPSGFLTSLSFTSIPRIITAQGAGLVVEESGSYRQDSKKELMIRYALKSSDRLIAISEYMKNLASDIIEEEKIEKIYNPCPPLKEGKSKILSRLGLEDPNYILSMCRHVKQKGLKYLIDAFESFDNETNKNWKLVLAGKGNLHKSLKERAKTQNLGNKVIFPGFVRGAGKTKLLKSCDIFCLPSVYEPLGIVLLEAMSVGRPIVSTETGGIIDIIKHSKNGLLFDPKDVEGLKRNLLMLTDKEKRKLMGKKGKEFVEKRFSIKKIANQHERLYKDVTG